ncbi:hypothetical protein [Streptomyces showdoensis]|nr:hypothetical protein [Streptomyces showdoensis]
MTWWQWLGIYLAAPFVLAGLWIAARELARARYRRQSRSTR